MNKRLILYVILFVLALVLYRQVYAYIQPYSIPTQIALNESKSPKVKTSPLFEEIGRCESNHDLHAKNKYSSASGEFQFINSSWYHYGKELWGEDFYTKNIWTTDNRELAWYVFSKYGTSDWNESKWCWGHLLPS